MTQMRERPRSLLYVPASNARALVKARTLPCDAVIIDLEDAVAPAAKPEALSAALVALEEDWGGRLRVVRVNAPGTAWHATEVAALAGRADAVLVPKAERAATLAGVHSAVRLPVWAMVETPRGVLAAAEMAAVPGVTGLVAGFNDLALALGCRGVPGRAPLWTAMSAIVLAARAGGISAFDAVWNAIADPDGLAAEARQAADWGFDGKTAIHPAQLAGINTAFAPGADSMAAASALIAAWELRQDGTGVIQHAGQMVEALHVAAARQVLARAR